MQHAKVAVFFCSKFLCAARSFSVGVRFLTPTELPNFRRIEYFLLDKLSDFYKCQFH